MQAAGVQRGDGDGQLGTGDQVGDDHVFHAQAGALHGAGAMRGSGVTQQRSVSAAAILASQLGLQRA